MENRSAPEPEKKKELKTFSFTRDISNKENDEKTPGNDENKNGGNILNLTLTLYDKEISLVAQRDNINPKLPNIIYEKYISAETLQGLNKIFSVLDTEKIFTIIKNSFEQKFDHIAIEEDKIIIKLMINFMEVMTEEIAFELDKIKLSSEEENSIIKESIKLLTEEKKNLKNEVTQLNNTIEELKIITSEKNSEIIKQIEENKNEYTKKLEENKNDYSKKIEENKNEYEKKLEENKTEFNKILEENKNEFNKKLEEKEQENKKNMNEFQNILKKLQKEMSEVKEIEKYVKEKIIIEEKEEKEIKTHSLQRKQSKDLNIFNFDIKILLFEEKIKFKIKEIQDDLKNNPILYETDFEMNYFGKLSDYYKNQGGIKSIYEFLILRFNDNEDIINRETNKIIIKVKYTFGSKEDEIIFKINKKEVGLKNILTNVDETLRVLNKDIIKNNKDIIKNNKDIIKNNKDINETKEEFKKDLLEKVYPIGSYYWSENDTSPEELFGGKWKKIEGRFLFASDSNHYVGQTGGEERHKLTLDEMPSHSHGYQKFKYKDYWNAENKASGNSYYFLERDSSTNNIESSTTESKGNSQSHNNMPPYLTANCWKRLG
jgi:chemotaxis protein histidine kinase CheA